MRKDSTYSDPHFDSQFGVLRNIPGITDSVQLQRYEAAATADVLISLKVKPVAGCFDRIHLQAIHQAIFANVYPWAGQLRMVNIQKTGSFPFASAQFLTQNLDDTFKQLFKENRLRGLSPDTFLSRAAYYLGELNALHPFREGNGRAQREFIRELALHAGYRLSWTNVTSEEMVTASIESHQFGRNAGLEAVLRKAMY